MMKLLFLILFFISSVFCESVPYKDCGSPNAKLTKVEFNPPCEKQGCILKRGENVTILANIMPYVNSTSIFVTAYQTQGYFNYETLMFQNKNICGENNITCPLESNVEQYAVVNGVVPHNLPQHKTTFRLVFTGDNDQRLFCGSCPIEIR